MKLIWELQQEGESKDKIREDVTKEGVVHKGMSKVEKQKECRTSQLTTFPQLTQSPTVKQSEIWQHLIWSQAKVILHMWLPQP